MASQNDVSVRADQAVAELQKLLEWALSETELHWYSTDAEKQVRNAVLVEQKHIQTWATQHRNWAEQGHEPSGVAYSWNRFFELGKVYGDSLSYAVKASYNASLFSGVIKPTVTQTAADVADKAKAVGDNVLDLAATLAKYKYVILGVAALIVVVVVASNAKQVLKAGA